MSGSISGQRKLFGHYKDSNNTDKDRAETRGASEHELDVYDVEVRLRHKLWDWNVANNRIRAELAKLAVTAMRSELSTREKRITPVEENYRADARSKLTEAQTRLAQAYSRKASLAGQVAYAEIRGP